MPGQTTPPWDQFRALVQDFERRIKALETQQQLVFTIPAAHQTGSGLSANGDPNHGWAVVVLGLLTNICGIGTSVSPVFGLAVWVPGTGWQQVT